MNYQHYSIEDYLLDKNFREWVENPDEALDSFWNGFMEKYPAKREDILTAKKLLQNMKFQKYELQDKEVDTIWSHVLNTDHKKLVSKGVGADEQQDKSVLPMYPGNVAKVQDKRLWIYRYKAQMLASLILLGLFTGLIFLMMNSEDYEMYATEYGETKTVTLSDGSVVTLNANSQLRVPTLWKEDKAREVWLEGEAFFEIQKLSQNDNLKEDSPLKFIVHTEGVSVEVLGTTFNVNNRREKVQVVLNTGKVRLKWKAKEMMMQPGDLVEVSDQGNQIAQKIVRPEMYSSWKANHLLCDATSLQQLAYTIEDRFGYEVEIDDDELKEVEVSGTIPLDDIETFKLVMSTLIHVEIEVQGTKIFIHK